jgi:hypothetical protein
VKVRRLYWDPEQQKYTTRRSRSPITTRRFVKGPLPLSWIAQAVQLPGKALHISLALWYVAGLQGSRRVAVTNQLAVDFGCDRFAKVRALRQLEKAGLVKLERYGHAAPRATLLHRAGKVVTASSTATNTRSR